MQGTRRYTEGLARARSLAEQFSPDPVISRTRYLGALKKAARAIGLTLRGVALIDMLFATSEDQDWTTQGVRPVVWPSNDWLCDQTGLSLTSVRRHMRELVDLSLIVPTDSPNGKRWGRRAKDGRIVAGYGFDLSPIAVRYAEFVEVAAEAQAQRAERQALQREFTVVRQTVQMIVAAGIEHDLPGDWEGWQGDLERVIERRRSAASLQDLVNQLLDLRIVVEEAFNEASNLKKESPKGAKNGTHILTTTNLPNRKSNERRDADASQSSNATGFAGRRGFRKPEFGLTVEQTPKPLRGAETSEIEQIPLGLVNAACPGIGSYGYEPPNTWWDLIKLANHVRPELGVSEPAWREACSVLGDHLAAVAIAVILEKHQAGTVAKPGGYLRGMLGKAQVGELNIARTLYGLSEQNHVH
ncbi:plasmid replication protein RepC [Microvirga alba]|uniref:Replication protein C n=1 Tax=Microvirga alba TaxID=2791025 RepID=A0A931BQH8_9HYPH|nr:plasmid replication protein RepC [Microvirga alba]MBF9235602.1 hypothetical protein [Microvirga alba]